MATAPLNSLGPQCNANKVLEKNNTIKLASGVQMAGPSCLAWLLQFHRASRSSSQGPPSQGLSIQLGGVEAASRLGPMGHQWGLLLSWEAPK